MQKESISKNFVFQLLYQLIILVIPLVLSPYLTRTLHEKALGTYTYINSIAYYFVVFANLGVSRHGQRIISTNSHDEFALRKTFWSLFVLHVFISLFVTIIYILYSIILVTEDKVIYVIETCYVLSALFDITWLFYGLENFRSVVIKNAIVKITECILIFCFVKSPNDLWIYTLITAVGVMLGQIIMIPQAIVLVKPLKFTFSDVKQHIKPLVIFAIAVIASTLYTIFDKTLLGLLDTKESVAFYEYSNRIITVPKTIVGIIGTVMYPRACKMAKYKDLVGQKKLISYSFFLTAFISVGSIFGLFAISKQFSVLYYGPSFEICGVVMISLSPLVYIIGMGDIIRTQYMIPNGMDIQFNISIILNAIVNLIVSVVLIPKIGIFGAVAGTISAEIFGLCYQLNLCRKFVKIRDIIHSTLPFVGIGFTMFITIKSVSPILGDGISGLLFMVGLGSLIYILLTILYLYLFEKEIWGLIYSKGIKLLRKYFVRINKK